jgi:hypothetical protein
VTGILRRFPDVSAIFPVYAVIAVPIFGWTITSGFWKLPSWLNFLNFGEISAIFAYAMMTAFLESLLVCGLVLLLCLLLPARTFRDQFVVRGTWLAMGLTLSVLGHAAWRGITRFTYTDVSLVTWSILSTLMIAVMTILSGRVRFMAKLAEWISDRLTVFLYILIPVSILSILIVFVRNAFSG